jgi:membrane protein implicated in regulation of membrane protease activity
MKTNSLVWAGIALVLVILLLCWFWKLLLGFAALLALFYVVWKIFSSRVKETFGDKYDGKFKNDLDDKMKQM